MKKKVIIICITLSFLLNGCSLDGWDALGIIDGVVSTATSDNNSGPTPIPTKSPETIEKEQKVDELLEQEYWGYDLAYNAKYTSGYSKYFELCLVDFDRQIATTIEHKNGETSHGVIRSSNISGTMDTDWANSYDINDKVLYKSTVYKRIIESDGEQVIEFFQKYNLYGEKEERIINTNKIMDLEEAVDRLKGMLDNECRDKEDMYDFLFPRE